MVEQVNVEKRERSDFKKKNKHDTDEHYTMNLSIDINWAIKS
jgi:hypothetical protein